MARRAGTVQTKKRAPEPHVLTPGPPIPRDWQARYPEHVRTHGHYAMAAHVAGICQETARRARHADAAFDTACRDAREEAADRVEIKMLESAERSDNPAGFIVRLKALRPAEYIEKNLAISVNLTAEVPMDEILPVLRAMLADASAPTKALLGHAEGGT